MGKSFDALSERHKAFIAEQKMFFVGTAPLAARGYLNVSPKGFDAFRVIDDGKVAYLDMTGSGIETVAHVKENGRLTIMFCAFQGPPLILRLYGEGEIVERSDARFPALRARFPELPGMRSIVTLSIRRVSESCGWGVPRYDFVGERDQYQRFADQKSNEDIRESQLAQNMRSIDGLPGLTEPSF